MPCFHDVILQSGSLPLGALEDEVARYIAEELAVTAPGPHTRTVTTAATPR